MSEETTANHVFAQHLRNKLSMRPIPLLAGLRAIAVFLVIFYHFGLPIPGGQGVIIFFVLSGFLITWLFLKEDEKYGRVSLRGFYWRRVLRIFPAFYFYWIIVVAMLVFANKNLDWSHAFSSFFFYTNYYHAVFGDPNNAFSHTWSLAIEEQFYLLWPMLFLRFRRNLKHLTIVLTCIIGAVWIHRFILYFMMNADQAYFYSAFDTRMDGLLAGCLLAVLLKRETLMGFWRTVCCHAAMPLIAFAILLASVVLGVMMPGYRDIVGLGLNPILMAVMLVQMLSMSTAPYFSWLEWRPMRFLGKISYSLFLYQQVVIHPVSSRLSEFPAAVQLTAAIFVTAIIATFSYYVVERPFLNLKAKGSAKAKAKSNAPAVTVKQTA